MKADKQYCLVAVSIVPYYVVLTFESVATPCKVWQLKRKGTKMQYSVLSSVSLNTGGGVCFAVHGGSQFWVELEILKYLFSNQESYCSSSTFRYFANWNLMFFLLFSSWIRGWSCKMWLQACFDLLTVVQQNNHGWMTSDTVFLTH